MEEEDLIFGTIEKNIYIIIQTIYIYIHNLLYILYYYSKRLDHHYYYYAFFPSKYI